MNNFILIVIILIYSIYKLTGLYYILPLLISIINIILATFRLIINPDSYFLNFVRLASIFIVIYIILVNIISTINNIYIL
jgi:hypothetical protein